MEYVYKLRLPLTLLCPDSIRFGQSLLSKHFVVVLGSRARGMEIESHR